jgi:choline-glycine betaine transporter
LSSSTIFLSGGVCDEGRWNQLFWTFALSIMPTILVFTGGLETLQTNARIAFNEIIREKDALQTE